MGEPYVVRSARRTGSARRPLSGSAAGGGRATSGRAAAFRGARRRQAASGAAGVSGAGSADGAGAASVSGRGICRGLGLGAPARRRGHRHRRLAAVGTHLLEALDESLGRRVLGVDLERSPAELQGLELVAALERHPGQPDDGDRIARVGRGDLPVERLGSIEQPDRQRSLGLEQQLDHRPAGSKVMPAP